MNNKCINCGSTIDQQDYLFCPYCGNDLTKTLICPNCGYENEPNSKFCQECGRNLSAKSSETRNTKFREPEILEIPEPPKEGITIEFPYSTSQSYDFAVKEAQKFPTYQSYGENKKILHRVTFNKSDLSQSRDLLEYLKGWRTRVVHVDGTKERWDTVFSFTWCYEKKLACFKPEFYCYGYENEGALNPWGCVQANLFWSEWSELFTWGHWLNDKADWEFDKERLHHELQKRLYPYRFCPAMQADLVEEVFKAFPLKVNPQKDRNWKFAEAYGSDRTGLTVTKVQFGFKETVVMTHVIPSGKGALRDIMKQVRDLKLPI